MLKEKKQSTAFYNGWLKVPQGETKYIKKELMDFFQVTSEPSWRQRLYGIKELTVSEYSAVEAIFSSHGIKDIWGI